MDMQQLAQNEVIFTVRCQPGALETVLAWFPRNAVSLVPISFEVKQHLRPVLTDRISDHVCHAYTQAVYVTIIGSVKAVKTLQTYLPDAVWEGVPPVDQNFGTTTYYRGTISMMVSQPAPPDAAAQVRQRILNAMARHAAQTQGDAV